MAHSIGYDLGSSFVKAALLDIDSGKALASTQHPEEEMPISAPHPGWGNYAFSGAGGLLPVLYGIPGGAHRLTHLEGGLQSETADKILQFDLQFSEANL